MAAGRFGFFSDAAALFGGITTLLVGGTGCIILH